MVRPCSCPASKRSWQGGAKDKEHAMSSASLLTTDMRRLHCHDRFVPRGDMDAFTNVGGRQMTYSLVLLSGGLVNRNQRLTTAEQVPSPQQGRTQQGGRGAR